MLINPYLQSYYYLDESGDSTLHIKKHFVVWHINSACICLSIKGNVSQTTKHSF